MASGKNKKRNKTRAADSRTLWGFLFKKEDEIQDDFMRHTFYQGTEEDENSNKFSPINFLQSIWQKFNIWTTTAILLFIGFTLTLFFVLLNMWTPQTLDDVSGYRDKGTAKDLTILLRNASGREISFTETEINRFLNDTCRLRQTGLFSIITHCRGVAVRLHDGYVEIIIDRIIGSNLHQTTSVNLSFERVVEMGRPKLNVYFHGGKELLGHMPRGGAIGQAGVPQHYMRMLKPALETLMMCYPEFCQLIEKHGYCPIFEGRDGTRDARVRFQPYQSSVSH